jgi:signal transduction histidine kinase
MTETNTTPWPGGVREDELVTDSRPADVQAADPRAVDPRAGGQHPTRWPRRVLLDSVYCLSALFLALPFFVLVVTGLALSAGLAVLVFGVFVLAATVYTARSNAFFERLRLKGMLRTAAPTPTYVRAPAGAGLWKRALAVLRDPQSWLDVLWSVLGLITGTVAFSLVLTWWAAVLGGLSYWFWQRWLPNDGHDLAYYLGMGDGRTAQSLLNLGFGVVALITLPAVARGAALMHGRLASALLCSRAELQYEVARVESSRMAAQEAEASSMRRLERDIHDGPQQRLVRLTMDLGRAKRRIAEDPDGAAVILDGALTQVQEAVAELRALSRGVAPPLLVDRGLRAALEELLSLSPVPVTAHLEVPDDLPPLAETTAYFVVAEAMTNVAKHSGAANATVAVTEARSRLRVVVTDDGAGGAHLAKGLGLAGLGQRLTAVGGTLELDSPEGGPTVVAAWIPLGAAR